LPPSTASPKTAPRGDPALLDGLPILDADFSELPAELQRELFDCFQLQVRYHQPSRRVTLRVTVSGDTAQRFAATANLRMRPDPGQQDPPTRPRATAEPSSDRLSLALRAPNRTAFKPR
jgi:site-specific DNA recombinase